MHTGSTHFSNVGKERLQPLTNESVRAEHGGWLHAESIQPCFYNLTITSLKRQTYEELTASRSESQKSLALEWKDWAIHLILSKSTQLPKDHSRTQEQCLRHTFKWHCIKLSLIVSLRDGCEASALPAHIDTGPKKKWQLDRDRSYSHTWYLESSFQKFQCKLGKFHELEPLPKSPYSIQNVFSSTVSWHLLSGFTAFIMCFRVPSGHLYMRVYWSKVNLHSSSAQGNEHMERMFLL